MWGQSGGVQCKHADGAQEAADNMHSLLHCKAKPSTALKDGEGGQKGGGRGDRKRRGGGQEKGGRGGGGGGWRGGVCSPAEAVAPHTAGTG